MPIDWKTQEHPDGSKTIWVGETEVMHRIKWSVGLTVYPDSSLIEAKVKIMNRSPLIQSFLYWANVSVHCDEHYQVIFPPMTQFGTGHSKTNFVRWPENRGVDLSWWKNFDRPESIFAWDFDHDFFAGYDHGKNAGTMHVANHHIVGGKKFFLWGNNPESDMWEKMLTDDDGQYLELMVGAYSDNQPDYSWIYPGEIREFEQYWYPIRDIRNVKNANKHAAVNMERIEPNTLFIGFNTTRAHTNAEYKLYYRNAEIGSGRIDFIDPATPFTDDSKSLSDNMFNSDLRIALFTAQGEQLIDYRYTVFPEPGPLPTPVETVKPAAEYETIEELYLTGLRIEQFYNARLNPMDYYNEALKRDPNDSRGNTAVGIRFARQARWEEAETHLRRAVERLSRNYTVPRDNEANYYLGYVLEQQGKLKEAEDQYWKATWTTSYQAAAYMALARIALPQGNNLHHEDVLPSLKLIDKSLEINSRSPQALVTKAVILRYLDREDESQKYLQRALEIDPLDFWAVVELAWQGSDEIEFRELLSRELVHRGEGFTQLQGVLEVIYEYRALHRFGGGALSKVAIALGEPFADSPMLHFYQAYSLSNYSLPLLANLSKEYFAKGLSLSPDGVFPSRPEEVKILEEVIKRFPDHPGGYYYLGNLLYYLEQKERAVENWEKAAELDATFGQVLRNLGFAYSRNGETEKAIASYEKGIALEAVTPRLLIELDRLYEREQKPVAERLALYEKFESVVMKHDDAVIRLLSMFNQAGQFDRAIAILDTRHFHVWEGGGEVHRYFVDAHLLSGMKKMSEEDYAGAVRSFEIADTYPDNLEVGRPSGAAGNNAKVFYFKGKAYQGLGNEAKARECFEIAIAAGRRRDANELAFFRGMALKELDRPAEADAEINALSEAVRRQRESRELIDQYSKFGEDGTRSERVAQLQYLLGLVHLARGEREQANAEFQTAIKANPDLIWARQFLETAL